MSSAVAAFGTPLTERGTVFIVDDDPDVRRAIALLVKSVNLLAEPFASPQLFLDRSTPYPPGCIVLDMRMPGISGLELQKELSARNITVPVIFLSAHGDISNATSAMRAGAVDFLCKPFTPQMLLERIQEAITLDSQTRATQQQKHEVQSRIKLLTDREHQVMKLLAKGESTKSIAIHLSISPKTVDNHRTKVLDKMDVDNPTQLAHLIQDVSENFTDLCDE